MIFILATVEFEDVLCAEKELEDILVVRPELIEKGLKLLERKIQLEDRRM